MKISRTQLRSLILKEAADFTIEPRTSDTAYSDPDVINDLEFLDSLFEKWDNGQLNIKSDLGESFFMLLETIIGIVEDGSSQTIYGDEKKPDTAEAKKRFDRLISSAVKARVGVTQTKDAVLARGNAFR